MPSPTLPRRDARRLALARLISISGNVAASVALAAVLWERTGSAAWVAVGALSTSLVAGTVTPFTGALADRMDRRRLMIASDIGAAICFGVVALLIGVSAPPVAIVLLAAAGAVFESPFVPASRAALPNLVSEQDLAWANGLLGQVAGLSFAVGPLIGGVLTGLVSAPTAMAFNAASFVGSALLVVAIRRPMNSGEAVAGSPVRLVREGLGVVWRSPVIRAIIASGFVAFVGVGFIIAANPGLADNAGAGAIGLGALWATWGVGAIIGASIVPRFLAPGNELGVVIVGFALQATALLTAAMVPFWWVVAVLTLGGFGAGLTDPGRHTLIQRTIADRLRGRVVAVMEAVGWFSFAVSLVVAGGAVDAIGLSSAYAVAGTLFVVGTLMLVVLTSGRRTRAAASG